MIELLKRQSSRQKCGQNSPFSNVEWLFYHFLQAVPQNFVETFHHVKSLRVSLRQQFRTVGKLGSSFAHRFSLLLLCVVFIALACCKIEHCTAFRSVSIILRFKDMTDYILFLQIQAILEACSLPLCSSQQRHVRCQRHEQSEPVEACCDRHGLRQRYCRPLSGRSYWQSMIAASLQLYWIFSSMGSAAFAEYAQIFVCAFHAFTIALLLVASKF